MTGNSEIKNVKEKQFWLVGTNKAMLFEGNIVQVIISGPQDHDIVHAHFKLHQSIAALVNGKVSYLIEMDDSGKFSPDARKLWMDIGDRADALRIAFTGSHPVARVLADFIISNSDKQNMQYFDNKEVAMAWLHEGIRHSDNIDSQNYLK